MGHTITYISVVIIALLIRDVTSDASCSVGTFSEGSKGFVRCEFGKDVRQGTHQISVVHCGTDVCSSKMYPLACSIEEGKLECPPSSVLPGYTFDGQVDSSLTLVIANLTEQTAGMYMCQVHPNDGSSVSTCNLDKNTGPPAVTAVTLILDPSKTNSGNQIQSESERNADLQGFPASSSGLAAGLFLVLGVCGLLLVFLFFIRYKNRRRQNAAQNQVENGTDSNRCKVCERLAYYWQLLPPPILPKCDDVTNTETVVFDTKEVQAVVKTNDNSAQCDPQPVYNPKPSHSNTRSKYDWRGESAGSKTDPPEQQNLNTEGPLLTCAGQLQPSTSGKAAAERERKSRNTNENQARKHQDDHDGNENENENNESSPLLAGKSHPRTLPSGSPSAPVTRIDAIPYLFLLGKDVKTWDNNDVCLWLKQVRLEHFVDNFKVKHITGMDLVKSAWYSNSLQPMSSSDLKKIGITGMDDQQAVQREIEDLIKNVK